MEITKEKVTTISSEGINLLTLLSKKSNILKLSDLKDFKIIAEIKYPDKTKKISTPRKPPGSIFTSAICKLAWNKTTDKIAIALMPSISGRYCMVKPY